MAEEGMDKGGGKGKLIIIILAILILLIGGAAAVYFLLLAPQTEEPAVEATPEVSGIAEPLEDPQFMSLGTYIANLKDGRRYLKATISLMLSEAEAVEYLNTRIAEVRDIVLSELQNLSTEETKQIFGKTALKNKIITKISDLFPKDPSWNDPEPIKKVLFEEFYVQ